VFDKVLIANRGEIACRIMSTLKRMGVGTVGVFTDADAGSRHVQMADEVVRIGDGPVAHSYLDPVRVLDAALATRASAIHPGYGFLSENATFAETCAGAGVTWIGPEPDHLRRFGDKHEARALATELGVPLLDGTDLLAGVAEASEAASQIGYPVMLKATAGGGGIGMQRCEDDRDLEAAIASVTRLANQHFGGGGVYLERFVAQARHVEVQLFGATGSVAVLGLRDCSAQRRHQKVIEETLASGIDPGLCDRLRDWALRLGEAVGYRSAGTVEFVVDANLVDANLVDANLVDANRAEAAFLEVNTRLQVEHGVTELVTGIDLVEWMVLEAAGALTDLPDRAAAALAGAPGGVAIEARVYAEDPAHGNRPGAGTLVNVEFPAGPRVDTWVEAGTEVTPWYDPLLAKILVHAADRPAAVSALGAALGATRLDGVATNLGFLRDAVEDPRFIAGGYSTSFLDGVVHVVPAVEVLAPGMQTTVQDHPGRLGYWAIGVPPSGPMDDLAFRLANRLLGNDPAAAGLEITFTGPTLRFETPAMICLTGAPMDADVDGKPLPWCTVEEVDAGSVLRVGSPTGGGCRAYLCVRGGFDVPAYLGSRSTFLLGGFGGHGGRALAAGDILAFGGLATAGPAAPGTTAPAGLVPSYGREWDVGVVDGPHGAPDFFTRKGIDGFLAATWEVHHHSDRTGIRLIGPSPEWARPDGGEAGLHPSNIHDTTYAIGTVDFTGDMPVVLGPDGPSLGGFVCPVTVVAAQRWKLGQLTAGDRVRFVRLDPAGADPVLRRKAGGKADIPEVTYRRAGDRCVLVEYGPNVLDLALRFRIHALMDAIGAAAVRGVEELAPGIRSLQVRYDPAVLGCDELLETLASVEGELPDVASTIVPSRVVHLPLSWDDPATRLAIERYMQIVRDDAPWCPWNIEFIRRINGLDTVDAVRRIVFDASYLVLGLGDVYLGAPVATPLDPRHRLVTTKYNPARTWTPENAVGIGGAYLCVYGMEGPGGYQFVGRTLQMWNRYRHTPNFTDGQRWLLRFFDQLRFFPVTPDELVELRRDFAVGRYQLDIEDTTLSLADHQRFLSDEATSITAFKATQQAAFDAERARWEESGELTRSSHPGRSDVRPGRRGAGDAPSLPPGAIGVTAPVHGVVVRVASKGDAVGTGDAVLIVEAMKMETAVASPAAGTVTDVRCTVGEVVGPGGPLIVVSPS
jgi:urea carboxylase